MEDLERSMIRRGSGSPPTAGPPPEEVAFDGPGMAALVLREEDLKLGNDFFTWTHTANPHKALFTVDDAAE